MKSKLPTVHSVTNLRGLSASIGRKKKLSLVTQHTIRKALRNEEACSCTKDKHCKEDHAVPSAETEESLFFACIRCRQLCRQLIVRSRQPHVSRLIEWIQPIKERWRRSSYRRISTPCPAKIADLRAKGILLAACQPLIVKQYVKRTVVIL